MKRIPVGIQDAVRAAVAAEREACARIAESYRCGLCGVDGQAAAEIRRRAALSAARQPEVKP